MLYLARDYSKKPDEVDIYPSPLKLNYLYYFLPNTCWKWTDLFIFFPSSPDQHGSVGEQDIHLADASCFSCCCDKLFLL